MSQVASSPVTAYTDIPRSEDFLGHPKGVFVCFFTEMWERFSFYGMKALLLLYFIKHHGFDDASGYDLNGVYGGLVYAVPVVGGLVADRWLGMRKSVVLGGLLLCMRGRIYVARRNRRIRKCPSRERSRARRTPARPMGDEG